MPSALRNQKPKDKKEVLEDAPKAEQEEEGSVHTSTTGDRSQQDVGLQKLIYDYLLAEDMVGTAKSFLKDVGCDAKHFKSMEEPEDPLPVVYASFQAAKQAVMVPAPSKKKGTRKKKGHDLLAAVVGTGDEEEETGETNSNAVTSSPKKKRKRTPTQKKGNSEVAAFAASFTECSALGMKEETQKQYTFGWKRYTEYCELHNLNTLLREDADADTGTHTPSAGPAAQILAFAQYLMQNPGKTVKSSVANSYVSAVGKKLLDAKVITAMKDIRTPELKELFADAARAAQVAASAAPPTNTLATASASSSSAPSLSVEDDAASGGSEDSNKKPKGAV